MAIRCVEPHRQETLAQKPAIDYNALLLRGHRQVVRHQLPKLVFAGSNPVARSMKLQTGWGIPFGLFCLRQSRPSPVPLEPATPTQRMARPC